MGGGGETFRRFRRSLASVFAQLALVTKVILAGAKTFMPLSVEARGP